jgi:Zinc knuckle
MTLLEKRIGDKVNLLSIYELKEDLKLRFERLSSKSEYTKHEEFGEEKALLITKFKEKCQNCGKLGHKSAQCKSKIVRKQK